MKCEVCGNDYDKSFTVLQGEEEHVFDSFECAIHALAPVCDHCGCRVVGHGVEQDGAIYCCAHCAEHDGVTGLKDRADTRGGQLQAQKERADRLVDEAGRESFPASDPPAWTTGSAR